MSNEATNEKTRITITLPPPVMAALNAEGAPLAMSGGEWLKHKVTAAYTEPTGVAINLTPVTTAEDASQTLLPLT